MTTTRESRKNLLIVWGVLVWSLCFLVYLVYAKGEARTSIFVSPEFLPGSTRHATFSVMAAVILIMAFALPRFLFRVMAAKRAGEPTVQMLFTPWILRMVLSMTIALIGFGLGYQSGYLKVSIPFFALTMLIYALHFPNEDNVNTWISTRRL